ncbi:TonB-dependent receptor [Thalassotalea sp. PP2-459]|uniref:TonB-dependent receptor n=1 Tax=Thalassotalea sp. PP2-459 TaxID=1742724 RepID=UPI00094447A2|nr:TonB-dependent receptor [Thalassotalea sp. PP2-459]OKY26690.1 TonB-dependent receptor [Thalassotalea sp. PP2-459]
MKAKLSVLAFACAAALSTNAFAEQLSSTIVGKVTDSANSRVFAGASIEIEELNVKTQTNLSGSFNFKQLPVGQYTLKVTYVGAKPLIKVINVTAGDNAPLTLTLSNTGIEEVYVRAQRSGQASAINQKRVADSIRSIVSADAIGQFPDQNAAESLQRLPGLSIERDQGEGRFVGIRGIDPNLNNVTINGLNVPSPEGGVRSVALDVIPSELIQTLAVSKSVTADMDGDAIGGTVEVRSVSAFDRNGDSATISGQLSQNNLRDDNSPKLSGSFTRLFNDTLGVAAAVSWQNREFGSDNIESNGEDEVEQRFYDITRERLGSAVNIDYRPDFNHSYFLRTMYSKFSDDEFRLANTFTFDGEDSEIVAGTKDRKETQTILSVAAGGEHIIDLWNVDYQFGYAKSDENEPSALYYDFVTENSSISADLETQIPIVTQDSSATDLSLYELDEVAFEDNQAEDTEVSFKFDLSRQVSFGQYIGEVKTGAKYRRREKTADANIAIFDGDFDDLLGSDFQGKSPDWGLGQFGPALSREALRLYFNDNRSSLSRAELDSELESNGASYVSNEDIFAAYLMTKVDIDKLRIVAGLRYENTDFSTQGMRVELIEDEISDIEQVVNTDWHVDKDYSHLLPSINLRYEFSDKLIARAAFSETISRPNFEDAAAFQIIESKTEEDDGDIVTEREAEVGNPDLKPYESTNLDFTVEYYPGHIGIMSAGIFYKEIDNFVVFADVSDTPAWQGFDEVIQPINGESANLKGIELSWVKAFDNGLLLAANGTFSDSDAVTFLNGERYETRLPNQSDTIMNFTLGYETDTVNLRLTMAHKSENFEEIDGEMLRMEDEHQQLDFTSKYYLNEQITLYFNIVNLTNEPFYHYFDKRNRNAQYEEYGRTLELGFRWQM